MAEWGNWIADGIAGNARKQAEREELEWNVQVDAWNAKVDRREAAAGRRHTTCGETNSKSHCTLASCLATGKQHAMGSLLGEPRGSGTHCIMGPRDPAEFLLH
jgi:hypothetical protein